MESFQELSRNRRPRCIRENMERDGYVLMRNLIDPSETEKLLREITIILRQSAWIVPGQGALDRTANMKHAAAEDEARFKDVYDEVFRLASLHKFPHQTPLRTALTTLANSPLLIHPKIVARLIFPNFGPATIHAHQDHRGVGGDPATYTAWLPLHDCSLDEGPLQILEGSHQFGLQETAGQTGYIPDGEERGGKWVGGKLCAGDVLFFHSLTVHRALPNISSSLRISMDFRFQSHNRGVNPATFVFNGKSARRSWEQTYTGWDSDELQYYWKHLPLHFTPGRDELAKLANSCEEEDVRLRHARTLERLDAQMHPHWNMHPDAARSIVK